ncbi:MAG: SAVED domain-containing protein [Desulfobacter sp.]
METRKKLYPLAVLGTKLVIASLSAIPVLGCGLVFTFPEGFILSGIQYGSQAISTVTFVLSFLTFLIGVVLIYSDVKKLGDIPRSTAKALITGMLGTSDRFPDELLSRSEHLVTRETVKLGISELTANDINAQVEMFNSEVKVRIYERFILHNDCAKIYLGGLARIPFLVAYGSCFRAVSAKIKYFDRFHMDGDWRLLNDEEKGAKLIYDNPQKVQPNDNGQIGISISFTQAIQKKQLSPALKDHTLDIKTNLGNERNLITNQGELERVSFEIQGIIDTFSSLADCDEIHFFIAVQSTVALEIGRRFQEGIHKKWVIHNFNPTEGKYDWALQVNKNSIHRYTL